MAVADPSSDACCYIKELPESAQELAFSNARKIFLPNDPNLLYGLAPSPVLPAGVAPVDLALFRQKYWGPQPRILTVSFFENPEAEVRTKILDNMNSWRCSVTFEQAPAGMAGNVRITTTGQGFWSYLGTDILLVPADYPTMCLEGFNIRTSDSEYRRVVRHETGHTLGFIHEQLRKEIVNRIKPEEAYEFFKAAVGWSRALVNINVLTPTDDDIIVGSTTDELSIMCYHLPASIMNDGKAVVGGRDINSNDFSFCHSIYPPSSNEPKRISDLQNDQGALSKELWTREANLAVQPSTCAFD